MKDYTLGSVIRASVWGMLLGGAVGFGLGLLIAPEEGKKMRRRMAYQLEHLADQLGALVDQVAHPEDSSEARRTGDMLVADAREKAQQIRDDIDALLGEVRGSASSKPSPEAE
ncbi:MAG: YtxH domain-containing protein [Rhodothermales bacterium]